VFLYLCVWLLLILLFERSDSAYIHDRLANQATKHLHAILYTVKNQLCSTQQPLCWH
jgi:hypothetical protein